MDAHGRLESLSSAYRTDPVTGLPCLAALNDEAALVVVAGLVAAVAAAPGGRWYAGEAALAGTDAAGREVWAEFRRPPSAKGRSRDLEVRLLDDHPCQLAKTVLPGGGTLPGALARLADRRWHGRASAAALMAAAESALALALRNPLP